MKNARPSRYDSLQQHQRFAKTRGTAMRTRLENPVTFARKLAEASASGRVKTGLRTELLKAVLAKLAFQCSLLSVKAHRAG